MNSGLFIRDNLLKPQQYALQHKRHEFDIIL